MNLPRIAHTSFLECSEVFCEHVDGAAYETYGDWAMVMTGLPFAALNFVTPTAAGTSTDGFADAHARLLDTGLPHGIALRTGLDDHLREIPTGLGYEIFDRVPAMVAVKPELAPWPSDLGKVVGLDALDAHADILMAAFGLPEEAVSTLTTPGLIKDDRVDVVVGRDNDTPVATALSITIGGVCGVFNVGTLESHRGRGYGAAVTSEVIRLGSERGADISVLQSSQIGFPVYEHLGFETQFTYIHWKERT